MPDAAPITIRITPPESVRPLRQLVLRPDEPPESCIFPGDDHPETVHFCALRNANTVAVASLYHAPSPQRPNADAWQLRGMATHPDVRGAGVGAQLLETCIAHTRDTSAQLLWCNARTTAVGFYQKYGFESLGDEFTIPRVGPHFYMHLPLTTPTTE